MGCLLSSASNGSSSRRIGSIGEVAVFVPGIRIPFTVDFHQTLGDHLSSSLLHRFSALRTRVVALAAREAREFAKPKRRTTRHGPTSSELLHALENYLPVLMGIVKDGNLRDKVQFIWVNQEDNAEETAIANAWYEALSVLHLMAMLSLSQANRLLLPRKSREGNQLNICEESRRSSIDVLLKAAGYLECAIQHVLPQIPPELRKNLLPLDLEEAVLRAQCLQALGQCVDVQLGMAIDSAKATLAVKRRLACEMANYWNQAENVMAKLHVSTGWAKKHQLFVKWKHAEAKAAAYYFHGLILDEGNKEKSEGMAIAALQASEGFLKQSKKTRAAFNAMPPTSRNPPLWGSMKYLSELIPEDASSKIQIDRGLYDEERTLERAPALPDFALALKPDDYQLPPLDPLWNKELHHDMNPASQKEVE